MDAESGNRLDSLIEQFLIRIRSVRRYSARTCEIYSDVLRRFSEYLAAVDAFDGIDASAEHTATPLRPAPSAPLPHTAAAPVTDMHALLEPRLLREYEVHLLDGCGLGAKTVNLHLSVLSSFCSFLILSGELKSNPVKSVRRPKLPSRLPDFYREDQLRQYFSRTGIYASEEYLRTFEAELQAGQEKAAKELYQKRLERVLISTLANLGIRRSELISLNIRNFDSGRRVMTVKGKGDKMREIPVVDSLSEELFLYLRAVEFMKGGKRSAEEPMFVTWDGRRIYPVLVDRAVKGDFAGLSGVTGRRSPHVLRHTLATELLDNGTDLNSIKEMLGHSSLAATQVYTHNSITKLKQVYESAHPRAKNKGGNYGD